jgi:hypothetical protein
MPAKPGHARVAFDEAAWSEDLRDTKPDTPPAASQDTPEG